MMPINFTQLYNELINFVTERIARQRLAMDKHDLRRVVAEQQDLIVRVRPVGGAAEEMFGRKDEGVDDEDARTLCDDSLHGNDSITVNCTDAADMASVASVENQVRDILADQLISIEEQKEQRRIERLLAAENAASRYYLTHEYKDGNKVFNATETLVSHGDKYIPTAFVKNDAPDEIILYK